MTEEVQTQAETPSTAPETTLEDVYKTYNVDEAANSFSASKQEAIQPPQPVQAQPVQDQNIPIPDPTLDPSGHKAWATNQHMNQMALRQALQSVAGKLNAFEQQQRQQAEEADIRKAVEFVNQSLGDSKLDPDVVEISMGAEARRDPRFLALWNNRSKNPKAFNEGMKAFSQKLARKFSMRADPQIAENQRALKEATSTKATGTPEDSATDRLGKLTGAAFDREVQRMIHGY